MKPSTFQFSRQELFDLVWASPISTVAKTFGISDVALAKACRKAGIPLPPRGYWAKLKAGSRVIVAQLPQRGFGKSDSIRIGDRYGYREGRLDLDVELLPPPSFSETAEEVMARAQSVVAQIKFPKTLSTPHHLIDEALKEDELRRKKMLVDGFYWKNPVFDTVEDKRKLKILNAIFFVMERTGEKPYLRSTDPIETGVIVGDTRISFAVEVINQKKQTKENGEKSRTKKRLRFKIEQHAQFLEGQAVWQDEEDITLEDQIRKIAAGLLIAGEFFYRAQIQRTHEWMVERKTEHEEKKRAERERLERERLERQLQLEGKWRRRLILDVSGWRRADEIRAFVAAVKARAELNINHDSAEKLKQWSEWAMAEADKIDPMERSTDELVDYLQRNMGSG